MNLERTKLRKHNNEMIYRIVSYRTLKEIQPL